MRLFDAIIDANHRALDGDQSAGLHLANYTTELPVVAMTCIDPRLNRLFPGVMGLPADSFIWLRNAGNIITGPLSSMMRSISLACAIKGGREIAMIGHTDCQVCKTTISTLTERFKALGIERDQLPQDLFEYFGVFSNERDNVIRAVDIVRHSPLISPEVPVQGLMVDVVTGKLDWVVNGYDELDRFKLTRKSQMPNIGSLGNWTERIGAATGEIKFPEAKIGEIASTVTRVVAETKPSATPPPVPPAADKPRIVPVPPPINIKRTR